ncbi:hypothetical protein NEICINOT_03153 [Neisseria cinerea ATCC 14685]|uniref:Uncharacterized protein n=1 Tax=Neisseria cinerea ATCC 14685 TaxID=546262 RepID=D0W0I6_NEICI|nr:hypothetical protein NEICINOT_03153 [Neisseria cinerea ATCC 14685]
MGRQLALLCHSVPVLRKGILKWVWKNFREWESGIQAKKSYDGIACRNGLLMPSEGFRRHFV